jgi:hypothetical protein
MVFLKHRLLLVPLLVLVLLDFAAGAAAEPAAAQLNLLV